MARMTGGAATVQALRHEGVEVVVALPGVQIMGMKTEPERLDIALQAALASGKSTVIEVSVPTWVPPFHVQPRTD